MPYHESVTMNTSYNYSSLEEQFKKERHQPLLSRSFEPQRYSLDYNDNEDITQSCLQQYHCTEMLYKNWETDKQIAYNNNYQCSLLKPSHNKSEARAGHDGLAPSVNVPPFRVNASMRSNLEAVVDLTEDSTSTKQSSPMLQLLTAGKEIYNNQRTKKEPKKILKSILLPSVARSNKIHPVVRGSVAGGPTRIVSVVNGGGVIKPVRTTPAREAVDPAKYIMLPDEPDGTRFACSKCGNIYKWRKSLNKHWKEKHYGEPLENRSEGNGSVSRRENQTSDTLKNRPTGIITNKSDATLIVKRGVNSVFDSDFTTKNTPRRNLPNDNSQKLELVPSFHSLRRSVSHVEDQSETLRAIHVSSRDQCHVSGRRTLISPGAVVPVDMTNSVIHELSNSNHSSVDGVLDLSKKNGILHTPITREDRHTLSSNVRCSSDQPLDFSTRSSFPVNEVGAFKEYAATKNVNRPLVGYNMHPPCVGREVTAHNNHSERLSSIVRTSQGVRVPECTNTFQSRIGQSHDYYYERAEDMHFRNDKVILDNNYTTKSSPNIKPTKNSPNTGSYSCDVVLRCSVCAGEFRTMSEVNRHFAHQHIVATPHVSQSGRHLKMMCPVTTERLDELLRSVSHSCVVCGTTFPHQSMLAGHYDNEHWSIDVQNPYTTRQSYHSLSRSTLIGGYKSHGSTLTKDVPRSQVIAERRSQSEGDVRIAPSGEPNIYRRQQTVATSSDWQQSNICESLNSPLMVNRSDRPVCNMVSERSANQRPVTLDNRSDRPVCNMVNERSANQRPVTLDNRSDRPVCNEVSERSTNERQVTLGTGSADECSNRGGILVLDHCNDLSKESTSHANDSATFLTSPTSTADCIPRQLPNLTLLSQTSLISSTSSLQSPSWKKSPSSHPQPLQSTKDVIVSPSARSTFKSGDMSGWESTESLLPFKCEYCEYRARWPSELAQHMKNHSDEKPYKCSHCGYRSKWKWDASKHEKRCSYAVTVTRTETIGYLSHHRSNTSPGHNSSSSKRLVPDKLSPEQEQARAVDFLSMKTGSNNFGSVMNRTSLQFRKVSSQRDTHSGVVKKLFDNKVQSLTVSQNFGITKKLRRQCLKTSHRECRCTNCVIGSSPRTNCVIGSSPRTNCVIGFSPRTNCVIGSSPRGIRGAGPPQVFGCRLCSFVSMSRIKVKRHAIVHSSEKPYVCGTCSYSSRWKSDIKKHFKAYNHQPTNQDFFPRNQNNSEPYPVKVVSTSTALNNSIDVANHLNEENAGNNLLRSISHAIEHPNWDAGEKLNLLSNNNPDVIPVVDRFVKDKNLICRYCDFKSDEITSFRSHVKNAHSVRRSEVLNNVTNLTECQNNQRMPQSVLPKQSRMTSLCVFGRAIRSRPAVLFPCKAMRANRYFFPSLGLLRRAIKQKATAKKIVLNRTFRRNMIRDKRRNDIGEKMNRKNLCYERDAFDVKIVCDQLRKENDSGCSYTICRQKDICNSCPAGGTCSSRQEGGICNNRQEGGICNSLQEGGICNSREKGGFCNNRQEQEEGICNNRQEVGICNSHQRRVICNTPASLEPDDKNEDVFSFEVSQPAHFIHKMSNVSSQACVSSPHNTAVSSFGHQVKKKMLDKKRQIAHVYSTEAAFSHSRWDEFEGRSRQRITTTEAEDAVGMSKRKRKLRKCDKCDYVTDNLTTLQRHNKKHGSGGTYKCARCDYSVDRQHALAYHIRIVHDSPSTFQQLPPTKISCPEKKEGEKNSSTATTSAISDNIPALTKFCCNVKIKNISTNDTAPVSLLEIQMENGDVCSTTYAENIISSGGMKSRLVSHATGSAHRSCRCGFKGDNVMETLRHRLSHSCAA